MLLLPWFSAALWELQQNDSCMLKLQGWSRNQECWMKKYLAQIMWGKKMELFEEIVTDAANFYKS